MPDVRDNPMNELPPQEPQEEPAVYKVPEGEWVELDEQEPDDGVGGMPPTRPPAAPTRRQAPTIFWPLLLVSAGVLLLLSNLGYLPWSAWSIVWRLWPVLLIALGIELIFGRKSTLGAVFSALLLLLLIGGVVGLAVFAPNVAFFNRLNEPAQWQVREISYPLGDFERARIEIDWTSAPVKVSALQDSGNLIEGQIAYRGDLRFDVNVMPTGLAVVNLDQQSAGPWFGMVPPPPLEHRWDVQLNPRLPLELQFDMGSGSANLDLSALELDLLKMDAGSGAVDLSLPGGTYKVEIEGGSGSLEIDLPAGVGVQIDLNEGSGSFRPGEDLHLVSGEKDDDGVWETNNWETADQQITIELDQGSGSVHIR